MRPIDGIAIVVAVSSLSGCAGTAPSSGAPRPTYDDCFFARTLHDWRPLDDRNLILFADGRRPYHVELIRPALGLSFDVMIGIYDRDGRICPYGGDAIVIDDVVPERIAIRSMRRLTDEQLEEVYVEFGIHAPAVIDAEEVELEQAEEQ
jgi:hypothetical protein